MSCNRLCIQDNCPRFLARHWTHTIATAGNAGAALWHVNARAILCVCVFMFSQFFALLAAAQEQQEFPVAKVQKVSASTARVEREFYGRVVALETVDLAFQVGGQITSFPVLEGTVVGEGDQIAVLDLIPFELALEQANAQYEAALRTLNRMESLGSNVSRASVDDARTNFDIARIQVDQAKRSLTQGTLSAPFDALVSSRLVANQSTVGAGTPVVRLHNMSEIRIEINVPEVLFQRAGRDPDVDLFARFPASEDRYPIDVREYDAETASVGQTYTITLGLAPPENLIILPGSSVLVEARINSTDSLMTIPRSALVFSNDDLPQVLLFEPTDENRGTVTLQPVEIRPTDSGEVAVTSGLVPGQEFVAAGASKLQSGQTVVRFQGFGN